MRAMKKYIILSLLMFFASCGKDNKSGVANPLSAEPIVADSTPAEANFRKAYHARGIEILREYSEEIRRILGPEVNNRMRKNLHDSRLIFSYHLLTDARGQYTSSIMQADGSVVLYVGDQEPNLNWSRLMQEKSLYLDQSILHNLLEQSQVDDFNMRLSRRIIRENRF